MRQSRFLFPLLLLCAVKANAAAAPTHADVVFAFDTTGSMQGEISNLRSSLSVNIIPAIQAAIPDVAFGLLEFRDFRTDANPSELFVVNPNHRVQTVSTSSGVTSIQNAVNGLQLGNGGDIPEAGWEAMYSIAGGPTITVAEYTSSFDLVFVNPTTPTAGESQGTLGGMGFRSGALPIVIAITDAEWHDAPGSGGLNEYPATLTGVPSRADAIARLNAIGARVISVVSTPIAGNPREQGRLLAEATGAVVDPTGWGVAGERPAGCAATQCCTGLNGAGETANVDGRCPLVYRISDTGTGLGSAVVDGVEMLLLAMTPQNTSTAISSSVNPSVPGQPVTLTATVTVAPPGSGTPAGTVVFHDGTDILGMASLSEGQAAVETSALALGPHSITATYEGDASFNGSTSSALVQTVQTIAPPSGVVAAATSTTSVNVTWLASSGAASYQIARSADGTAFDIAGTADGLSFDDSPVSSGWSYLYVVRAVDGLGGVSTDSNRDLATTVMFVDDPVMPQSTVIKAQHVSQLRVAVQAVRELAGLSSAGFDPIGAGAIVRALDISQLRDALHAARLELALAPQAFSDAPLPGKDIKATHIEELRLGVR